MTDSGLDTFEIFGVTLSECQSCGVAMVGEKPTCNKCIGNVPASELEELVEEWREKARQKGNQGVRGTYLICADELEAVIEDE